MATDFTGPMADPDSSAPLGWKLKWFGLVVGALYSGYQVTNRWHWWPPVTLPLTWLDRAVPLLEWTVWPYLVLAGCIFLPLLLQDRHVFRRCMVALGCGYSVNLLIFAVWPTMLPREGLPDGWHHAAFAWLYAVDTPANCFPSGHITAPFIAFHALAREHRHWRGRLWLVFAMLCPTILTTKQHYVVDLLGGLATGMFGVWLSGKWAEWAVAPLTSSPGAQRNPFLNLLAFQRDPLGFLTAVGQGGGPVARCRLAWLRRTVISDPAVARAVLRLPLRTANKDTWSAALISRVSGRSVLTSNGDAWVRLRRLAQPAFHHERITAYSEDIHRLTTALISDWRAAPGGRLEVGTAMRRLTFRFICRALLSADPSREITALESAINRLLADTWRAIESPFLGRLRLATWERRAFDAALAEVRSFIQTQINTRRQSAAPTGRDLLAMLMAARDADTGAGLTDQEIINECITLIIGGHDSTANALAWSLALLAAHPDVADRLRAEATQSAAGEALARAVFLETLRLYPPIWLLERNVVEPATVGTWSFAAGEQLLICPWVLHRDPKFWDQPAQFRPERFLDPVAKPQPTGYAQGHAMKHFPPTVWRRTAAARETKNWLVTARCLSTALWLVVATRTAVFAAEPAPSDLLGPTFNLVGENDMVVRTDRHFTHGTKLTLLGGEVAVAREQPGFHLPVWLAERTPDLWATPRAARLGVSIGQNICTPTDISTSALQVKDRPYAGVLYASLLLQKRGVTAGGTPVLDNWRVDLGVIGPESQAEEAQNTVHRVRNLGIAQGWAHQLQTEPALALRFQRTWRWADGGKPEGWGWDFLPTAGVSLGNIGTYAAFGGQVRAGWRLPGDFGVQVIDSIAAPSVGRTKGDATSRGIYAFAGVEGRAVAYTAFLDGNLWQQSHHVDKFPLVGDTKFGLVCSGKRFDVTLAQVIRTKEFAGQREIDSYGSLAVSVKWDHRGH